jgi:ribosomal protein S18 acetylase RimI-like enzyme
MKTLNENTISLLQRRDLANFVRIRSAHPGDDFPIGELLVSTFRDTYARKLPSIGTTDERERELRDVATRRQNGTVRVIEVGYRIIGCYSLIHPASPINESWSPMTCTLRCLAIDPEFHSLKLSEKLLWDAVLIANTWQARMICLHVQIGADGVARLYENFGFRRSPLGDKICNGQPIEGYLYTIEANLMEQKSLA